MQNDTVLDVVDTFVSHLRRTQAPAAATTAVLADFAHASADSDEGVQIRLGLALAQWQFGALEPARLKAVDEDLAARRGIASYGALAGAREKAVRAFLAKLAAPNPKPRALPKAPKAPTRPRAPKPAVFEAGDCLALRVRGGWRAAAVLVNDVLPSGDGFNVVAVLKWRGAEVPTARLFSANKRAGTSPFQSMAMFPSAPYDGKSKPTVVGHIVVDPARFGIEKTPRFWTWKFVGREEVLQFAHWADLLDLQPL